MRKIFFLFLATFSMFFIEYFLSNLIQPRFVPNFLLLLIIFVDLYLGIRYGIMTAVMAGIMKDSFELNFFGIHVLSFLSAAYLAIFLKKYLYMSGSRVSRLVLVTALVCLLFPVEFILESMFRSFSLGEAVWAILLPQVILTPLVSYWTFYYLKRCASRLYV